MPDKLYSTERGGYFPTADGHQLYWERHGRQGAQPLLFLHGGPAGSCSVRHLAFFDLQHFDVLMFDQRGCGLSNPHGETKDNTTAQLLNDIDALRRHFGFERISLLGISWGSWLALRYHQHFPDSVAHVTVASLFVPLCTNIQAYEQQMERSLCGLPFASGRAFFEATFNQLHDGDSAQQRAAALRWAQVSLRSNGKKMAIPALERYVDETAVRAIHLELHYHLHDYFFTEDDQAPERLNGIRVVQGVQDLPGMTSLRWLQQHHRIDYRLVNAGHDALHPSVVQAVRECLASTLLVEQEAMP